MASKDAVPFHGETSGSNPFARRQVSLTGVFHRCRSKWPQANAYAMIRRRVAAAGIGAMRSALMRSSAS